MNVRNQIRMPVEMKRRAKAKAADLGISFTEYVWTVIVNDLSKSSSSVVDVGSTVARGKDKLIGEASRESHSPKNRKSQRRASTR